MVRLEATGQIQLKFSMQKKPSYFIKSQTTQAPTTKETNFDLYLLPLFFLNFNFQNENEETNSSLDELLIYLGSP